MASSIFGSTQGNSIMQMVGRFNALKDPNRAYTQLYQSDPQFRQFADSMRGMTPQQAFSKYGLDYDDVRRLIR